MTDNVYKKSLRFIKDNESKRLLTGQESNGFFAKFYHFALVFSVSFMTLGAFFILMVLLKKKEFHPFVQAEGSNSPLDLKQVEKAMKSIDYDFEEEECPLIFIRKKGLLDTKPQFLMFTNKNLYFSLNESKMDSAPLSYGKISINSLNSIKTKGDIMSNLTIAVDEKIIGSIEDCNAPRVKQLLKTISNDVKEGGN